MESSQSMTRSNNNAAQHRRAGSKKCWKPFRPWRTQPTLERWGSIEAARGGQRGRAFEWNQNYPCERFCVGRDAGTRSGIARTTGGMRPKAVRGPVFRVAWADASPTQGSSVARGRWNSPGSGFRSSQHLVGERMRRCGVRSVLVAVRAAARPAGAELDGQGATKARG